MFLTAGHLPLMVGNLTVSKNPYLCGVKKGYLKYYDRFVLLAWVCILLLFWWQYDSALNTWQSFLLSACCFGSAYPFTTFLSKTLLSRAVEKRSLLKFALQFFLVCLLFSFFIPLTGFLFYHVEHHSAFPDMRYFETGKALNDYIAAIFISFILNFGFCGLRFFEINLKLHLSYGQVGNSSIGACPFGLGRIGLSPDTLTGTGQGDPFARKGNIDRYCTDIPEGISRGER
jgi:hypothetical protein